MHLNIYNIMLRIVLPCYNWNKRIIIITYWRPPVIQRGGHNCQEAFGLWRLKQLNLPLLAVIITAAAGGRWWPLLSQRAPYSRHIYGRHYCSRRSPPRPNIYVLTVWPQMPTPPSPPPWTTPFSFLTFLCHKSLNSTTAPWEYSANYCTNRKSVNWRIFYILFFV